ncbi:MAG: helix-turn-helix domain-containing protein [Candidatus Endonucleobacter sp. (ex Gigantidas childressi)]|nr:helix-turn-helix domain-containing protein [Candidatus Endonucleobacter sp. (ex Gigantidas childressi)]
MTITYQQLAYEQLCQISALKKSGCSQREIAEIIGTSQSTVSRELARNTGVNIGKHKAEQIGGVQSRLGPSRMKS